MTVRAISIAIPMEKVYKLAEQELANLNILDAADWGYYIEEFDNDGIIVGCEALENAQKMLDNIEAEVINDDDE